MRPFGRLPLRRRIALLAGIGAMYYVAAKLGLSLAFQAEQVSAVWPPTGIALAAVLIAGYGVWPAIALGAFLANATSSEPLATALGIAAGNTAEALLGAFLLELVGFRPSLERLWDVFALIGLAAVVSTSVSASIGVTSLCLGHVQPWAEFGVLWRLWWVGDAVGNLVVAPLLLAATALARSRLGPRRAPEALVLLGALFVFSLMVFTEQLPVRMMPYHPEYAAFPFVIWAALRFGQLGTTFFGAVVSAVAVWGTANGLGPFAVGSLPDQNLVLLQVFLSVLAVTGLLLGAAIRERDVAEERRAASYAVTQILIEASTLKQATPRIVRAICEALDFDVGALWTLHVEAGVLRCQGFHSRSPGRFTEFEAITRNRVFEPGVGLPGRVLARGEPAWIEDVVLDSNFPRAPFAAREGLHGAFGFPILLGGKAVGALEFFSVEPRKPDEDVLRLFTNVGSQIGQFIERGEAREAVRIGEERLWLALGAGRMGVWDWNVLTGKIQWSEGLERIHGLEPRRFAGTFEAFLRLVHEDDRERVHDAITRLIERGGESYEVEYRNVWPDSSEHWIAGRGKVVRDDQGLPLRVLGVGIDVTAGKRLEEDLRRRALELAEADRRKDEFVAMLGHELRNPLAPIRNALELMRLDPAGATLERAQAMIERQVRHMVRLVDDLLDVSRMSRGKIALQVERIDLGQAVAEVVEAGRPLADSRQQTLAVTVAPEPLIVEGDATRLVQVFTNLLDNAVKYTPPGGALRLEAGRENGMVVVRVEDSGIGMPAELLARAFDLFAQGSQAPDRLQSGLGIGLTLARRIVELHGGSIEARSEGPGRGSELIVRLPAAPAVRGAALLEERADEPALAAGSRPLRLLVVDDNVDVAESLALLLRTRGHDVRVAHDGPEAIQAASAFVPDTVLLDIGLEGMDGYAVARALRADHRLAAVRLIAVSGYGHAEARREAVSAGFDHHLVKPVELAVLEALLRGDAGRERDDRG